MLPRWLRKVLWKKREVPGRNKGRLKGIPLSVECLEDRTAPVVGATTYALPVFRGQMYDGVVLLANSQSAGTGALLDNQINILTAAHVVSNSASPTGLATTVR